MLRIPPVIPISQQTPKKQSVFIEHPQSKREGSDTFAEILKKEMNKR